MTRYRLDDLEIDLPGQKVSRSGDVLPLPELSFQVLACLIRHAPAAVSTEVLSTEAWRQSHVTDDTIAQRIALIRKSLGDTARSPRYIRTLRGRGYTLAATLETLPHHDGPKLPVLAWAGFATGLLSAVALALALTGTNSANTPATPPAPDIALSSITSQQLLERARDYLRVPTAAGTEQAIDMLERAHDLAPDNLAIRIQLSFALSNRVTKFGGSAPDQLRAEALARSVLDSNPDWYPAWSALAFALDSQGQLEPAIAAYTHAYSISPTDTPSMSSAAYLLGVQGRLHDALVLEARARLLGAPTLYSDIQIAGVLDLLRHPAASAWYDRAETLNPGQLVASVERAESRIRNGEYDRAISEISTLPDETRNSQRVQYTLGRAYALVGDMERAQSAWRLGGYEGEIAGAAIAARSGDTEQARDLLANIRTSIANGDTWPRLRIAAAELATSLGNYNEAEEWLARAINVGWRDWRWIEASPALSALRQSRDLEPYRLRIQQALADEFRLIENDPRLQTLLISN